MMKLDGFVIKDWICYKFKQKTKYMHSKIVQTNNWLYRTAAKCVISEKLRTANASRNAGKELKLSTKKFEN